MQPVSQQVVRDHQDHQAVLVFLFLCGTALQPSRVMAQFSGTFRATGTMTVARSGHSANLLPNGRVSITGGVREIVFGGFESYSPRPNYTILPPARSLPPAT